MKECQGTKLDKIPNAIVEMKMNIDKALQFSQIT